MEFPPTVGRIPFAWIFSLVLKRFRRKVEKRVQKTGFILLSHKESINDKNTCHDYNFFHRVIECSFTYVPYGVYQINGTYIE